MSAADFQAVLPALILAAAAVLGLLLVAVRRHHGAMAGLTLAACLLALAALPVASAAAPHAVGALLLVDRLAVFYMGLLLAATAAVALLSYHYLAAAVPVQDHCEEFYLLLLLASTGGLVLVTAAHFAAFFLAFELLTVSLYAMIGYLRSHPRPLEAALKYLVLSAASTAFLLFGLGLLYFDGGVMDFRTFASALAGLSEPSLLALIGSGMVLTGVGFKLAVAPFHLWAPDVYEGAPAPVTAYVATVSKAAVFGFLLHVAAPLPGARGALWVVLAAVAATSMFAGNLLALQQTNVKRLLACSSIAHLGYLLVAFLAAGPLAVEAVTFYLVAYVITTLGAFGIVVLLSRGGEEAETVEAYRGLLWRRPWAGLSLAAMLLSLAGIPVTAGFVAKFYVVAAGAASALWLLLILVAVNSVIGLVYYLRWLVAMVASPLPAAVAQVEALPWTARVTVAVMTVLLLWLGILPGALIRLIQRMAA